MGARPPLTEHQILEIVRLYKQGESIPTIAPKVDRSTDTIRRIIMGRSFRSLTCHDHVPGGSCPCLNCAYERCRDDNLTVAERSRCQVRCQYCRGLFWRKVLDVVSRHGLVFCDSCDGRRSK